MVLKHSQYIVVQVQSKSHWLIQFGGCPLALAAIRGASLALFRRVMFHTGQGIDLKIEAVPTDTPTPTVVNAVAATLKEEQLVLL